MAISVQVSDDAAMFDTLARSWTGLLQQSANDTFFLTPAFQRTWWRHLGVGELALVTAHEGDDLVGVAPLFSVVREGLGRTLQTVGCVDVSDYLDWILAPAREKVVLEALFDLLDSSQAPAWDAIDLCNVHQDSPTLQLIPDLARARGWAVEISVQAVCPVVTLPATWDDYLAMLNRKQRHETRRKMRRAEEYEGTGWYVVGPEHDLTEEMESFLSLMAKSAPEKAQFLTPANRAFFQELGRVTFEAGWLQLAFFQLGDQKLASYLNFVYGNRVLVYNSGLDWQNDPGLSSGIVLTGYLIRQAIDEAREAYDFLRGDEVYKYRLGGQDVTVHRLLMKRAG